MALFCASIADCRFFERVKATLMTKVYDLAVVGAGVVGLAQAWAAARLGKRVVVIDRDAAATGASIRNFGFITITGQARGDVWRRARRSRDLWARAAAAAGIVIEQEGLVLLLRHGAALDVAEAFLATEMGVGCEFWDARELGRRAPGLKPSASLGALYSPHELRVESRIAIPRLAAWLAERHGVVFLRRTAALTVTPPVIETSRGRVHAGAAVVCPGDDLGSLFPEVMARRGVTRCALSMLRLADPGFRLPAALMSDLSLVRYLGYAALPEAEPLRAHLEATSAEALAHGVHLIVVQSADGSLVVGDSHHYADAPAPFMAARTEALILEEFQAATGVAPPPVTERWIGTYASAEGSMFVEAPAPETRLVVVTSGTGASTAFAIAEEVIGELYGADLESLP
jgi:FAD dependent oxidoreductase TIGR03364